MSGSKRQESAEPSPKDDALALALAMGMTRSEAATHAGVGERTVYTKLKSPDFKALIADHRRRLNDRTVGLVMRLGPKGVEVLAKLLDHEKPEIQLQAAKYAVGTAIEAGSSDIKDRLAALEARVLVNPNDQRKY
jgi:hypothetical protein